MYGFGWAVFVASTVEYARSSEVVINSSDGPDTVPTGGLGGIGPIDRATLHQILPPIVRIFRREWFAVSSLLEYLNSTPRRPMNMKYSFRLAGLSRAHNRLVNTLDGERFSTYSQHLRDMYNFDPSAVEKFLKEMRVLATNGQNAAYGMRAKVGAKGLVNGIAASPRAECAAATASEYQGSVTVHGADAEGGPAVEGSSRRAQTRQAKLRKSFAGVEDLCTSRDIPVILGHTGSMERCTW